MPNNETKSVPKQSLAYLFPQGFNEFWTKCQFKEDLEQIKIGYIPATQDKEEMWKTLMGGYGWNAVVIAKHLFTKYQYRTFEPHEDIFVNEFKTNTIFIISDIRKKEHLWQNIFREIDKFVKPLEISTDTRISKNYDNTKVDSGNIKSVGANSNQTNEQKQISSQSVPIFANIDLTSGQFGGFQRQQQLANKQTEQGQNIQSGTSSRTTAKQNLTSKEFFRSQKDANVSITKQKVYELNSVSRLLNNFQLTFINWKDYYKLMDKLFIKFFGASVIPIIDEKTGQRKWVSQTEYEEIIAEESPKPKLPEANEWDETIPYLERLKIVLKKTEKEYAKLPDTSNRKPRVALRLQIAEGAVKAYSKEDINLPSAEEFRKRVQGEVEGYSKIIGYENILQMIEDWLDGWDFYKEYGGEPPEQLMICLLGSPGLGKTYISQALAKALNRGFHVISMNGKQSASIVYGTDISNPGAEPGEIAKAISKREDRASLILLDELEKAGKDAKRATGNPTDRTINHNFKDDFFDFPTPANELIFFVAINYPEDLPDFVRDRFRVIEVPPLPYHQRLEVVRLVLRGKLKSLDNAFQKIYGKNWEEIYHLFNQEELLKKSLTRTFSIRGAKDNIILSLIPTLIADFLKSKQTLPTDLINYDWKFVVKEELDKGDPDRKRAACPYALDKNRTAQHRTNCECFMANLAKVPGWAENMEQ
ncbi:MAG: AAA family ATPase [Spiroplasmataceae bacterium]|nr:AAA family ATPase [Spiroplasmataceae bacterium]